MTRHHDTNRIRSIREPHSSRGAVTSDLLRQCAVTDYRTSWDFAQFAPYAPLERSPCRRGLDIIDCVQITGEEAQHLVTQTIRIVSRCKFVAVHAIVQTQQPDHEIFVIGPVYCAQPAGLVAY